MPGTQRRNRESFESLLRRFKKSVDNSKLLTDLRIREHFEKPCDKRKRKAAAAKKREQRRRVEELSQFGRKKKQSSRKKKRKTWKRNTD